MGPLEGLRAERWILEAVVYLDWVLAARFEAMVQLTAVLSGKGVPCNTTWDEGTRVTRSLARDDAPRDRGLSIAFFQRTFCSRAGCKAISAASRETWLGETPGGQEPAD